MDDGLRREDLAIHIRREHMFEDSFRELHRRTADEWKHRFYIVFEGGVQQKCSKVHTAVCSLFVSAFFSNSSTFNL